MLFLIIVFLVSFLLPFGATLLVGRLKSHWPDGHLLILSASVGPTLAVAWLFVRTDWDRSFASGDSGAILLNVLGGLIAVLVICVVGGGMGLFAGIMALMFRTPR